jgi:hypothetical protein
MLLCDNIKIEFDAYKIAAQMRLDTDRPEFYEFLALSEQVKSIVRPKALVQDAKVISANHDRLSYSSGNFNCGLLAQLAGKCKSVFPFITTCGKEIEKLGVEFSDPLHLYWLDRLKEYALEKAFKRAKTEVEKKCDNQKITSIIPMDDEIWPVSGLEEIFAAFTPEDIEKTGVELTEYFYMIPAKTRAGIFFPADKEVDLCSLCNLRKCKTCQVTWSQ